MKIDKVFDVQLKTGTISGAETRKVTDLLESSPIFEKEIKRIRKFYKIPVDGYPQDKSDMEKILKDNFDSFYDECLDLTYDLKLPEYWSNGITTFAFNNIFVATIRKPVKIMASSFEHFHMERWFDLVIAEKISKTELLEEIEKEWPKIEEGIKMLPKPLKHKMIRSVWAKRIVELRDVDKKHFKDIADILGKENQGSGSEDVINEDYVKILYHRWKRMQKVK